MLIKSAILTQASGSVGGMTASRNRGGMYFRARAIPTDPKSALQLERRTSLAVAAAAWGALSEEQRDSWNLYGLNVTMKNALGDPIQLSGQQHWLRFQTAYLLTNTAVTLTAASPGFSLPDAPNITTAAATNDDQVTVTLGAASGTWASNTTSRLLVFVSRAVEATQTAPASHFRFAGSVAGAATPPASFAFDYTTIWGVSYTLGQRIWLRFRVITTNALSPVTNLGPVQVVTT